MSPNIFNVPILFHNLEVLRLPKNCFSYNYVMYLERYTICPVGITILRAKMAAILNFSHFCIFQRKTDDLTEFRMPFYIYTQGFIIEYAVLAELLGKI